MTELSYTVTTAGPETHLFQVEMTLSGPSQSQQLRLPAWIPGSYMIRDFARNIVAITAQLDDEPVPLKQLDKQTWQIDGHGEQLLVRYQVYAGDLSVRGAHLDHTHGYFNGSALFLCPVGMEDTEAVVVLVKPAAEEYRRWRLATSMTPDVLDDHGFGEYRAEDYEDLIDHPVEMGEFSHHEFEVEGVPHQLVLTGRFDADLKRISSDLTKICTQHAALFGGLPLDRYVFLTQVTGSDYGGLEHRFSTSLIAPRSDLPVPGDEKVSEGYRRFLGLCSHEYFHLWNVKRIRPEVLKEADLSSEVYTSLLWAFEGITSYYDDLGLLRAGCISLEEYLDTLAQTITRVMRGSGRHKQSVAESSFNAWSKFYKQDENASNAIVSYYAKGTLVALGLDVLIRENSNGAASLDTLMRRLWQSYGEPDVGIAEGEIEQLVAEICNTDVSGFFQNYVYGVTELPLDEWLATLGIGLSYRAAKGSNDNGGLRKQAEESLPRCSMGVRYKVIGDYLSLVSVSDEGAAQVAGLSAGDRLVAIDGLQVKAAMLDDGFPGKKPGELVAVAAFRRDELMQFNVQLARAAEDTCDLFLQQQEDENLQSQAWRANWSAGL